MQTKDSTDAWGIFFALVASTVGGIFLLANSSSNAQDPSDAGAESILEATHKRMRELVLAHRTDWRIRRVVGELLKPIGPNRLLRTERIFEFVRDGINYLHDPGGEYVAPPIETLMARAGDCDCKATLLATLLEADGAVTRFLFVPGHVLVEVLVSPTDLEALRQRLPSILARPSGNGFWIPIDPTAAGAPMAWASPTTRSALRSGEGIAVLIDQARVIGGAV